MKKLGVLVPQSKSHLRIGKDFINGLRLNLDSEEWSIVVEGIGLGNDSQTIVDKMDKLSFQEDVSAIIGFVGDRELTALYEKANVLEVPSVFVRLGAFPDIHLEDNEYAFTLSYGLCDGLEHLGTWLVKNNLKNVAVSGSYNDVGYGFISSLEKSLYNAGGSFAAHFTPPINPRPNEAEILRSFYEEVECDAIVQLYNGVFAKENVSYLESFGYTIKTPLIFSPFALDAELAPRISKIAENVMLYGSWFPASLTGKADAFEQEYVDKYEKEPSVHSMLGYEAGLVLTQGVASRVSLLNGEEIRLEGPRGECFIGKDLTWKFQNRIWESTKNDNTFFNEIDSLETNNIASSSFEGQEAGWHNAYLCY